MEPYPFDVFLCHNSKNKEAVRAIGAKLQQEGLRVWLDEWELRPGLPWIREIEKQIGSIGSAAVVVGGDGMGPWQSMEVEGLLREFFRRHCPVIPVLLLDAPSTPALPLFLEGMTWVDFRADVPDPMEQLIYGITGRKRREVLASIDAPASGPESPKFSADDFGIGAADMGEKIVVAAVTPFSNVYQISEPTQDFIGREDEIELLVAAFDRADRGAVISGLRGMGGVGKTELAKVVAKRVKDRFPDGQIMFNLRGARDDESLKPATAAEALHHVIRAFHPEARLPEDVDALRGLCHSVLEGKRVLLLMDNALDAQQLAPLVPPPDGCALIVTSRHAITLAGMKPVSLDMLPPDMARALLLEICPRIGDHADTLAERCGYLPLALRLAASALARRVTLSVEDYLQRLADEKQRLAELDKDQLMVGVDRGITATLATSYNLFDESMRRRYRALGVFPADFDAAAAAAVWEMEGSVAEETLDDFHGASMIQWDETTRRYRLHDLARVYARGLLYDLERFNDGQRHATHYAAVLRAANVLYREGGEAILRGLTLFDRERINICAEQDWAAANAETDDIAAALSSDYPDAGVYCVSLRMHARERIAWFKAAVAASHKLVHRLAEGNYLSHLGIAYAELGEPRKSIEYQEQRLVIALDIGDRRGEAQGLGNLGTAYADLGESDKAIEYLNRALIADREIGDRHSEAKDLGNLGLMHALLGDTREAFGYFEQSLVIHREFGDRRGEAGCLHNLGNACADIGNLHKAIEFYEQALIIDRGIGDRRGEAHGIRNIGIAYAALGDMHKATEFYEQLLDIAREIGDRQGQGAALGNLGNAFMALGETRKAIEYLEQHLDIACEIGNRRGESNALGNLGNAYAALGETRKAMEYYQQQLNITREIGYRRGQGNAHFNLGNFLVNLDRREEAVAQVEQSLAIYEQIESPNAAKARELLERLRATQGREEKGTKCDD